MLIIQFNSKASRKPRLLLNGRAQSGEIATDGVVVIAQVAADCGPLKLPSAMHPSFPEARSKSFEEGL